MTMAVRINEVVRMRFAGSFTPDDGEKLALAEKKTAQSMRRRVPRCHSILYAVSFIRSAYILGSDQIHTVGGGV